MQVTTANNIDPFFQIESSFSKAVPTPTNNLRQTTFLGMISENPEMRRIFNIVERVAKTDSTVLILGESGTGKELFAKAIHRMSGRCGKLVPVNCGAIPEDLLESELFGHEKGSFTGATNSRIGRFQMADGGTIFLDEIGDMCPKLQVKLLRVLQERKIEPVGSTRTIDVNVRVIAATHKDLREEVRAGRFREDLYYRLQVVPIVIPALKDRGSDVRLLTNHFLEKSCAQIKRNKLRLSADVEKKFASYQWPGNVRELENLIERLAILSESDTVQMSDLPEHFNQCQQATQIIDIGEEIPESGLDFNLLINNFENKLISMALKKTNGNKKAAARLLNLNRTTLVEKIKKKGLASNLEVLNDIAECCEANEHDEHVEA